MPEGICQSVQLSPFSEDLSFSIVAMTKSRALRLLDQDESKDKQKSKGDLYRHVLEYGKNTLIDGSTRNENNPHEGVGARGLSILASINEPGVLAHPKGYLA